MDAFGHTLFMGLGYADRMMFSNTFLMSEMLAFSPDLRFAAVGLSGHRLCLTVQRAQWRLLPRNIRIRLVESGRAAKIFGIDLDPSVARKLLKLEVDY